MTTLFSAVALLAVGLFINAEDPEPTKIMTFNIRYDNPNDATQGNGWDEHRKKNVVKLIKHYDPDFLGIQEAMPHQLDYMAQELEDYAYIGEGRDGGNNGEYSAIFYKKDKVQLLEENTFWLSPTPDKVSKGWDANLPRIVTWGHFKNKDSNKDIYFFNTHFDHIGETARAESARLLLQRIDDIAGEKPVIVSGDFNATPDSDPYKVMTEGLIDAVSVSLKPAYGPKGTFSGFDIKDDSGFPRIDYVFVKDVEVVSHETITDYSRSKYPSDHLPVVVQFRLKG